MATFAVAACGCAPRAAPAAEPVSQASVSPGSKPGGQLDGELTEAEVIRLAGSRDPRAIAARYEAAAVRANEVGAALYPNPSISWDREHLPRSPGEREDTLSLSVPLDLSSRRSTRRRLARADSSGAKARAIRTNSDVVARAVTVFYELIAAERRVEIQTRAVERLAEAARVVARRKQAGKVSGYDQARIEIEAELAASLLGQSRTASELMRAELALLLGIEESAVIPSGRLEPETDPADRSGSNKPPDTASLRALRDAEAQTRAAKRATNRWWIPAIDLTLGLRLADAEETRYGYVAGVSVDVPVFSRGQDLAAEARSRTDLASARVRAAQTAVRLDLSRALRALRATRAELERFDEATRDRVAVLERAAESGYREGERSLVELLDARRAKTAVETRRVELALSVRRADIALRAARGEFE